MPSEKEESYSERQRLLEPKSTCEREQKRVEFQNRSFDARENGEDILSSQTNGGDYDKPAVNVGTTNFFIYFSHFLTKWGERMWTFAVGLFLIYISPDSLQLTAVYGLTMGATVLLLGPLVGDWVDNTQRLRAARATLILQTLFVVLCSAVIYAFLKFREELLSVGDWMRYVIYAAIITLSAASLLANTANTITVEKDWIVAMCSGDDEKLATMTARMKAIDLSTQILAPVATGQIMAYIGTEWGAVFIAAWNIVTVILEYYLIWKVYKTIPALRNLKDVSKTIGSKTRNVSNNGQNSDKADENTQTNPDKRGCLRRCRVFTAFFVIIEGWKTYSRYPVMLSGLALSCLFMTVLGFDNVTVGYAKIQGLNESIVGIMMGGAGFLGILGTFAYPMFRRKMGLPRSGMVALILQLVSLSACLASIWLPGSPFDPSSIGMSTPSNTTVIADEDTDPSSGSDHSLVSVLSLMSGIIAARFGLWIADLSITQMFMQTVKEEERGVVFGVQNSLNQLMNMLKYGCVTGLPLAPQFGFLVLISFSFMVLGDLLYAIFLCRLPRGLFSKASLYTKI